ncbi:hypothetical protein V8F44DRAFT_602769 [Aspergillus fumigatus]
MPTRYSVPVRLDMESCASIFVSILDTKSMPAGARWSGRSRAPPPTATILLLFLPPAWRSGWQGRRQQHPSQRRCRRGRRSKPAPVLHSGRFRETPLSHPGTPFAVLSAPATCSLLNTTHLCVVQSAAIAEHLYPIATVNLTLIN